MNYFKLTDIKNTVGNCSTYNYSPINPTQIEAGTCIYNKDMSEVVFALSDVPASTSNNLTQLTETEYKTAVQNYLAEQPVITPTPTVEQQLADMKTLNAQILSALVTNGLM